ncbi:MAG: hypothetical protein LBT09_01985 [Planctomycetaceae bacterium]|nr:hypothetical protein [Planctomycetaceae bacterium]
MSKLLFSLLFLFCGHIFVLGENYQSININMAVYPDKFQYGDAVFVFWEIKNNTGADIIFPSKLVFPYMPDYEFLDSEISLLSDKKIIYQWTDSKKYDEIEGLYPHFEPPPYLLTNNYERRNYKPTESFIIAVRVLWCPQYEFSPYSNINFNRNPTSQLQSLNKNVVNKNNLVISSNIKIPALDLLNPDKSFQQDQYTHGTIVVNQANNVPICIESRTAEQLDTIARWFLEIPATYSPVQWTIYGIFASPFYVRESPYNVKANSKTELAKKRELVNNRYNDFYTSLESLTPEIKSRIKRTNEIAAELLKQPDTSISPYMKEFIYLRGLLIDLRYADENDIVRNQAFEKLVTWLQTAKYKTLWILVLQKVGLKSITNNNHFPQQIVNNYIDKLSKIFPKEINATIEELNKEYKNISLNNPEPANNSEQELLPSDSTSSSTASESLPNSDRRIDSTHPQQTPLEETSSWGFVTVLIVILFVLTIIGIIFVQKIFRNESKL